jgi:hypothetical protein
MDSLEFTQWRALIELVEPHEQEQAEAKAKSKR